MSHKATQDSSSILGQALDEYLTACAANQPPDRDEFLRRFPELSESLEQAIRCLEHFRVAAPRLKSSVDEVIPGLALCAGRPLPLQLGDYLLRREVGRGGMGIVYEAEQLSLRRRVAIKVLPLSASLDPLRLRRFQVEAQITACLHHPHIVPVHGVGSDAGVHYYVMQFIDGCSTAEWLRQRLELGGAARATADTLPLNADKTPPARATDPDSYRTVAQFGLQAADALAYAHGQGVIHRDIKPGNLLIDTSGKVLLSDFGVAFHAGIETMPPTLTGDVMGTLAYLSPEQALGQRDRVDGRSDVYSLGASLYELLVGRPPFRHEERQEVLRQILHDEPLPLRKYDAAVPVDLETVVLKCLAKTPADRYGDAAGLAADLRRFLTGQAVLARRPSVWQHGYKWAIRNRAIVKGTLVTLLLGLTIGVGLSMTWIRQAYEGAKRERRTANELSEHVQDFLDSTRKSWNTLWHAGGTGAAQRAQLVASLPLWRYLADGPLASEEARWRVAEACWWLGAIESREKNIAPAIAAHEEAVRRGESVARDYPDVRKYRVELQNFRYQLAVVLAERRLPGDRERSQKLTEQAERELTALFDQTPDAPNLHNYLLQIRNALAVGAYAEGRYQDSLKSLEKLLKINQELAARYPDHPLSHIRMNGTWYSRAMNYRALGQLDVAIRCLREAVRHHQLLKELPDPKPTDRADTWASQAVLGELLLDRKQLPEAEQHLVAATLEISPMVASVPDDIRFRRVGRFWASLGKLYLLTERPEQAAAAYHQSETILPGWPPSNDEFAEWLWLVVINPHWASGQPAEMAKCLDQLRTHHRAHRLFPLIEVLIHLRQGQSQSALEVGGHHLSNCQPGQDRCRLLTLLALSHLKLGDIRAASSFADEAKRLAQSLAIEDSDLELLLLEYQQAFDANQEL